MTDYSSRADLLPLYISLFEKDELKS